MATPFIGEVKLFGFNFPPQGYASCNGQLLPIAQNQALFALLGTIYGGNGTTTFALPNLQSRTPIHFGNTHPIGTVTGEESVTLTSATMPAHTHNVFGTSATADKKPPPGHVFANDTSNVTDFFTPAANLVALAPQSVGFSGGSQPHDNMQPYLVMNYCIALVGVFPSRN